MSEHWVRTASGGVFDFDAMLQSEIDIEDIAHSLSMQCRFAGHTRVFYSVAEHSVRVAWELSWRYRLQGLLHDASEAYCQDIIRPLKHKLGDTYGSVERAVQFVIGRKFGCELVKLPERVVLMDNILLATEKRDLMAPSRREWSELPAPLERRIIPWDSAYAKLAFLRTFEDCKREASHEAVEE